MGSSEGEPFRSASDHRWMWIVSKILLWTKMPALLPREGVAFENYFVPFLLGLQKDKAWDKLPNMI
jgi:hypothetical protein